MSDLGGYEEKHLTLAKELLSPLAHIANHDNRWNEYVEIVAKKLATFENEVTSELEDEVSELRSENHALIEKNAELETENDDERTN